MVASDQSIRIRHLYAVLRPFRCPILWTDTWDFLVVEITVDAIIFGYARMLIFRYKIPALGRSIFTQPTRMVFPQAYRVNLPSGATDP